MEILFFEEEHKYLVDGIELPSVTTILSPLTRSEYGAINPSVLAYAARRGSDIHEYLEMLDYGAEPELISGEIVPYVQAYKEFLRDYKPVWEFVETPVASEKGYVGTLDRAGLIDGVRCIVDLKTISAPSKMEKFSVCAQTWAYQQALEETKGAYAPERYALYLNNKGEYNLMDCEEYEKKYGVDSPSVFGTMLVQAKLVNTLKDIKPIKRGKTNE